MEIKLIIGDSAIIKVAVVDGAGRPFDLKAAGCNVAYFWYTIDGTNLRKLANAEEIKTGNELIFKVPINAEWPPEGSYPYAIEAGDDGALRYTVLEGMLTFKRRLIDVKI